MTEALLDVNVLVALVWPQHIHHRRARQWSAGSGRVWVTTPITEVGLLRLSLNRSVTGADVSAAAAIGVIARLRSQPGHRFLQDDCALTDPRIDLSRLTTSAQVTDLHLVNLCAAHGLVLATLDRGIPEMLEPGDRRHVEVIPAA